MPRAIALGSASDADASDGDATTTAASNVRMCILVCSDDKEFRIPFKALAVSVTFRHLIDDMGIDTDDDVTVQQDDARVPVPPNVDSETMAKIAGYMVRHAHNPDDTCANPSERKCVATDPLDIQLVNPKKADGASLDIDALFKLIKAANFLDIYWLLKFACRSVAESVRNKPEPEVRKVFSIETEFTEDEKDAVRKANPWCDDRDLPLPQPPK